MSPDSTSAKLPKELATRILDRAASLDTTDERIDLATLRSAAIDAGISPDAFERALVESLATSPVPARRGEPSHVNFYEMVLKASVFGAMGGLLAIAVVSVLVGNAPDKSAMMGAMVGGVGVIGGVVAYFKGKLKP